MRARCVEDIVVVMTLSFLLSAFIGWIYKITHRRTAYTQSFVFTLVLNGMVVALIMALLFYIGGWLRGNTLLQYVRNTRTACVD